MSKITIKYKELMNGMQVYVEGHLFVAQNVRTIADPEGDLVRFEGYLTDPSDDCFKTGYNGGTYGGRVDRHCVVEVPALSSVSPIFFVETYDEEVEAWVKEGHYLHERRAIGECNMLRLDKKPDQKHRVVDAWGCVIFPFQLCDGKENEQKRMVADSHWGEILERMNEQRNALAMTIAMLRRNQDRLLSMLTTMRNEYGKLHDGLSDMLGDEEGPQRLFKDDIPDDYEWLVTSLAKLCDVDHNCETLLKEFGTTAQEETPK